MPIQQHKATLAVRQYAGFAKNGHFAHKVTTCRRAIYDQSYEDIGWHVGDNNGMPQDPPGPLSDLAHSIPQHDTPPDPIPETSGRTSTDRTSAASSTSDSKKRDGEPASTSSRVQSALRQAADIDSVAEGERAKKNKRWQRSSALQTIALDSHDLPTSTSSSQEVGPCLKTCGARLGDYTVFNASSSRDTIFDPFQ